MATTDLSIGSNRLGSSTYMSASVTSVAVDAVVSENFRIPPAVGDILLEQLQAFIGAFSADYVPDALPIHGFNAVVVSSDATTIMDILGSGTVAEVGGTAAARPSLAITWDPHNKTIVRTNELIALTFPIASTAGATATVQCRVRGRRLRLP